MKLAVATCLLAACGFPILSPAQSAQSPAAPAPVEVRPTADAQTPLNPLPDIHLPRHYQEAYSVTSRDGQGSVYIPMDSWIYPALDRLHALGYLDTAFFGLRPWTRLSVLHMLDNANAPSADDDNPGEEEAEDIYRSVLNEVGPDLYFTGEHAELDRVYTRFLYILKPVLNDSYHLGQTIINDYGRPYQTGLNNITGAEGRAEAGRFTLHLRAEIQHAPSAAGYSLALGEYLSHTLDNIPYDPAHPQATLPVGPIGAVTHIRVIEANASYHLWKHELSIGKSDHWLGPAKGGAMAWSTNADNIYSFQINRIEPFYVPLLRRVTGPIRYDFFVGTLGGHTVPNHPWVHMEKISIHPTRNLELGFERTVIWGGRGHEPVNLHTFLRSFVDANGTTNANKFSSSDPGARFSAFDFTYRLPGLRNWVTLYTDSFAHDDVSPISAPRRAAIHPGIYLSHFPGVPKLDLRLEAASTDCVTKRCHGYPVSSPGQFYYYEAVQQQGTTNKGFLYTDPIGRDDKGAQAWLTYHLSPQEQIQFAFRNVKADKNFIPGFVPADPSNGPFTPYGGTTQDEYRLDIVKRLVPDLEVHIAGQFERWEAPVYMFSRHRDLEMWGEVTWYPHKQKQLADDPF